MVGRLNIAIGGAVAMLLGTANPALSQDAGTVFQTHSYADLAALADASKLVVKAKIRKQAELKPERAPGLQPGWARLYVEAETDSLLMGSGAIGEALRYLVDVPRDSRGKAPKLKKREVLLFALPVPARRGELQLVAPDAQLLADPQTEARIRPILQELVAPDSPPVVTKVRDSLSVAGNLVGESETQIFLETQDGSPVSISVIRRPGMAPHWGVSWTEIVDQAASPPRPETLAWYRLACSLPAQLPPRANLSFEADSRQRAADDYQFVIRSLGPCTKLQD